MDDMKIYTTESAARLLKIHEWELMDVLRFVSVPKIRGRYFITRRHMDYLRKIHEHFIRLN